MEAIAMNFERIAARWGGDTCELDTLEFVEACEHLGEVFDALGGPVFQFASVDYMAKARLSTRRVRVKSVREAAATHPTLRSIVETDIAAGNLRTQGSRARNLWRVLNALRFLRSLLILIKPEESSMRLAATEAYNETMASSHVWVIRQAVWLALYWSPTRQHFFESLSKHGGGVPIADVADSMARYITASETVIRRLDAIYPGPCVDEHGA